MEIEQILEVVSKQDSSGKKHYGKWKKPVQRPKVKSCTVDMEAKEAKGAWEEWVRDQVLKKTTEVNQGQQCVGPFGIP